MNPPDSYSPPGTEVLCPAILWGSTSATKRAWTKLAEKAWSARDWEAAASQEMRNLAASPTGILYRNDTGYAWSTQKKRRLDRCLKEMHPLTGQKEVWHLNWILEIQPSSLEEQHRSPREHMSFINTGMKYPWFSLGMFHWGSGILHWITGRFISGEDRDLLLPFLRDAADSLDFIMAVKERLYRNRCGILSQFEGVSLFHWFLHFLDFAGIEKTLAYRIRSRQLGPDEMFAILLEERILDYHDGKYRAGPKLC